MSYSNSGIPESMTHNFEVCSKSFASKCNQTVADYDDDNDDDADNSESKNNMQKAFAGCILLHHQPLTKSMQNDGRVGWKEMKE